MKTNKKNIHYIHYLLNNIQSILFFLNNFLVSQTSHISPLKSVADRCLIVAFRPLPAEWHRLGLLIELSWRSDSNAQQMAVTCLHFEWLRVASLPHTVLPAVI